MNTIRKDLNTWGKLFAVVLALTFMVIAPVLIRSSQAVLAQPAPQVGDYQVDDYRTTGSGVWTDMSNWEICTDAYIENSEWVYIWDNVTNYPGQTGYEGNYAVTIRSDHVISDNNVGILDFGNLLVGGHLDLCNDLNLINTEYVLVDGSGYDGVDIETGGSIRWLEKLTFSLHANAILNVINVKYTSGEFSGEVIEGLGLYGPHARNNNMRLKIGEIDYAAGVGGGNVVYTFDEINSAGGALQAIATADPEDIYYIGSATEFTTTLTGEARGLGSEPEYTTFEWTGTGPNGFSFAYSGQNSNPGQINLGNDYGTYTFRLTVTSNYKDFIYSHYHEVDVTVHQAPITITALDQTKEYDETFTFEGTEFTVEGLIDSDTVGSVTLSSDGADASAAVGTYTIIPSEAEGIGLGNYAITYINGTFSVIKPILTITALDQIKEYGEIITFTGTEFTVEGLKDGDSVYSVTLSSDGAAASAVVGTYTIMPGAALGTSLENYTIIYESGILTVDPKALTITADSTSKTYGDTVTFAGTEFTSDGLVNGDSIASVTLTSDGAAANATVDGSPYDIEASNATGSGLENYTITYIDGKLTVSQKALTITADDASKTYGDMVTFAGTEFTSDGLVNGDSIASVTLTSDGAAASANVDGSPYDIVASNATGSGLENYTISYVDGVLTVNPRALTINADDSSKTYSDMVTFAGTEFTSDGLVNGDSIASVTLTSDGAAADANVDGSPYDIVASNATGSGLENYTITYVDGALTVYPLTVYVTFDDQSKTYGDPDPELTCSYTDMVGDDTLTIELTREVGEDAGAYAINQEGAMDLSSNYVLEYTNEAYLNILPLTIDVPIDPQSKTYGDPDPELTYSYPQGLVGDDTLTIELTREAGEDVGTYAITQGNLALSTNYIMNFTGADLTIDPLIIHVIADPQSKIYGDADPALTYSCSPELVSDDAFFAGKLTRESGEDAGTYTINQGNLALDGNYFLDYTGADLTIVEIPASFEANNLVITPSTNETWAGITFTRDTNEDVLVTVEVSNTGGQSGTYHGVLKLNGEEVSSKDITLEPGESGQLTFNVNDLPSGDYTVEFEELSGEFSRDNWTNWWLISTLILTVVFIGYLVKRFGFDGKRVNWTFEEGEN